MNTLVATLVMMILFGSAAHAQHSSDRTKIPSITVSGEATIFAEPDQAQIDIGVITPARSAPEAST